MASQIVPATNRVDELPSLVVYNEGTVEIALKIDKQLTDHLEVNGLDRESILNARRFLRMSLNETLQASEGTLQNISPDNLQNTLIKIAAKAAQQGLFNNGTPETVNLLVNANTQSERNKTLSFIVKTSTGMMFTGLAMGNAPLLGGSIFTLGVCGVYSLGEFVINQIKK